MLEYTYFFGGIMESFITIGTKSINQELFRKVVPFPNNYVTKPYGGLWLSPYYGINANEWLGYLEYKRSLFYMKFNGCGALVNVKDNANILRINSVNDFEKAYQKYPSPYFELRVLDYMKISKDYDGIFIDRGVLDKIGFSDWCISSLVIFNLECIGTYVPLDIDYVYESYSIEFSIAKAHEEKTIAPINSSYQTLYRILKESFEKEISKMDFVNLPYDEYYHNLFIIIEDYVKGFCFNFNDMIELILRDPNLSFGKKSHDDIVYSLMYKLFEDEFTKLMPSELTFNRSLSNKRINYI